MAKKPYYITTAIAYASGKPHIGNTYEIVLADSIARYKRFAGYDVRFMTGTDEHGQKIEDKAFENMQTPKEFVDETSGEIKRIWDLMNTSYDKFIRTTDDYHEKQETYEELESLLVLDKQCCHTARIILESGQIDSEEKNNCGKTPFLIAAERGAWKIGALLSGQEPETDELAAITGGLNLFQALWYGAEEALDALLRSGADTQVVCEDNGMTDFKGKSPLGCALTWENFSAAELLLRGGADPNFRDSEERTAFAVWMSNRGHGCEYKEPCLHFLQCLTVCGWDLESPADKEGNTALSVACRGAKYDTGIWAVRYLVENGADVNAHNMQGQTPAMNLYGGRYWDGNIPRFSGFARSYPYDGRACTEQDAETLEVLLEAGADINVKDKWGNTLLHYIAGSSMRGSKEATELVMEFGTPDVSAVNNEGLTALDIAAKKNDETLVKFLLKYS